MKPFALVAVAAAAAVLWATGALAAPTSNTLTGTVGPGFTISLTQDGQKVTKLKAGDYTLKVDDKSDQHDFHITGATVNKLTSITGMGKTTWHITLKKGTYTFVCDPHSAFMKGSFRVK